MTYSIIIPHHNIPTLLERCLKSIPERGDLEIIIVDDNSDADVVDFDNFPGLNRRNVTVVFDKDGGGAGHARNIGLKYAVGDWLFFCDADDYLSEEFNDVLDKYADETGVDMVFFNSVAIDESGNKSRLVISKYIRNYLKGKSLSLDVLRFGFWAPWSRLIRRSVFINNRILFEEIPVGNDVMAILKVSACCEHFAVEPSVIYYYYQPSGGSFTAKAYNFFSFLSRLEQRFRINQLYREVGYPFQLPILNPFSKENFSKTAEVRAVLKRNSYNVWADYCHYFRRIIAKVRGVI